MPGEKRAPRAPRRAKITTPDPVEIALETAADEPDDTGPAHQLLLRQRLLIDSQIRLALNEEFRNRIKAVRDVALTLGAVAFIGLGGWLVWSAAQADEMVLEPWTAPPGFVAQGQGGEVLAAELGDRIKTMQTQAEAEATGVAKEAGGQTTELTLEIPQTGVSVGELEKWLRRRLGHQTVVGGAVVQRPAGRIAVTVRPGDGADTFEGAEADLPALLDQAARATLKRTDPLRYAGYLIVDRRYDEAETVIRPLTVRGSKAEQANALANLVNVQIYQGRWDEALITARKSVALDPNSLPALIYLNTIYFRTGREQGFYDTSARILRLVRNRRAALAVTPFLREQVRLSGEAVEPQRIGDFATAATRFQVVADQGRSYGYPNLGRLFDLTAAARLVALHDHAAAAAVLRNAGLADTPRQYANNAFYALSVADDLDRREASLDAARRLLALQTGPVSAYVDNRRRLPDIVVGLALGGDLAGARALAATMPLDCSTCARARGRVALFEENLPEAERWFAASTRQAPGVADGWSWLGQVKRARGDLDGALAMYRKAQQVAPRWSDPWKLEADLLMAQGKTAAAIKRYAIAAERAPRWGALHLAWGDALARAGHRDEAQTHWKAALGCGLSAANWAAVKQRLAAK